MYNIFLSFSFNHLSNTCKKKYNTHTHTLISFIKFTHTPYSHTFTQLSQFNYNHNTLKINKKKKLKMDIQKHWEYIGSAKIKQEDYWN